MSSGAGELSDGFAPCKIYGHMADTQGSGLSAAFGALV